MIRKTILIQILMCMQLYIQYNKLTIHFAALNNPKVTSDLSNQQRQC
jgi:hypothetical protein